MGTAIPGRERPTLIWDSGASYYAYVGLAERVLIEEGLGEIVRPGMGPPFWLHFTEA